MLYANVGRRLYNLCKSMEDKFDGINGLLEGLSKEQRREVVRYEDEVRV